MIPTVKILSFYSFRYDANVIFDFSFISVVISSGLIA